MGAGGRGRFRRYLAILRPLAIADRIIAVEAGIVALAPRGKPAVIIVHRILVRSANPRIAAVASFGRCQRTPIELLGPQPIRTMRRILGTRDRSLREDQKAEKMFAPHEGADRMRWIALC